MWLLNLIRCWFSRPVTASPAFDYSTLAKEIGNFSVHFSPKGGCEQAIIEQINQAKEEICLQAYAFTSHPIANALIEAKKLGINVEVIMDAKETLARGCVLKLLKPANIKCYADSAHSIAHSKLLMIDKKTLITGSFNFSAQAEYLNGENLLIIHNIPELVDAYLKNFEVHKSHSN